MSLGKITYVMAPKTIYKDKTKYHDKIKLLKTKYPDVNFILPHNLFKDNRDWREKISKIISKANSGVLLTDKGVIGIGCYFELTLLRMDEKPVYLLYKRNLTIDYAITLLPEGYWHKFAKVKVG